MDGDYRAPDVPPLFGISMRQPPRSDQAEQALLGALMANNRAYDKVAGFLRPEHFADPVHGRIYGAIGACIDAGHLADAVTMATRLANDGTLQEAGGTAYLAQLLSSMVSVLSAPEYGRAIHDAWVRRELIEAGERLVNGAFDGATEIAATMAEAATALDGCAASGTDAGAFVDFGSAVSLAVQQTEAAHRGEKSSGLSTGMSTVDAAIGGLEPDTFTVLGGRTGMGKSALGWQWALAAARKGVPVIGVSLEMSAVQLARRALAAVSGISIGDLKHGRIEGRAGALARAQRELDRLPLRILDTAGLTPTQIRSRVRESRRKHGCGLVVVDHLHIVRAETNDARHGGTYAVGRISNALAALARELHVPVLALAQLSRALEAREDKRPTLADLRQAGDIEQDADAVCFVYRPEYYLSKSPPERKPGVSLTKHNEAYMEWDEARITLAGKAELICAKVRDGESGTVHLRFNGPTTSFSEPGHAD